MSGGLEALPPAGSRGRAPGLMMSQTQNPLVLGADANGAADTRGWCGTVPVSWLGQPAHVAGRLRVGPDQPSWLPDFEQSAPEPDRCPAYGGVIVLCLGSDGRYDDADVVQSVDGVARHGASGAGFASRCFGPAAEGIGAGLNNAVVRFALVNRTWIGRGPGGGWLREEAGRCGGRGWVYAGEMPQLGPKVCHGVRLANPVAAGRGVIRREVGFVA
jgi:hypothetical protein